jgi:hypothetical protein
VLDARAHERPERAAPAEDHVGLEAGGAHALEREPGPDDVGVDDEQHPATAQVRRRLGDQPVQQHAAVAARGPRALQPAHRQLVGRGGHVGRVGDDDVVARIAERREEVAAHRADPHAVEPRVEARGQHGAARQVDGRDRARTTQRRAHGQRPAAGAHVEHGGAR